MSDYTERIHEVVEALIDWFDEAGIVGISGVIYIAETPDGGRVALRLGLYSDEPGPRYAFETHFRHSPTGEVMERKVARHTYDRKTGKWSVFTHLSEEEVET